MSTYGTGTYGAGTYGTPGELAPPDPYSGPLTARTWDHAPARHTWDHAPQVTTFDRPGR